jgi:hypothetical protein
MYNAVIAGQWPPQTPPLRDFLLSPGFAGVAVILASAIALAAILHSTRRAGQRQTREIEQQDKHQQEHRADRDHEARIQRCWQRFVWLVDTAASEPTGLGVDHGEHALLGLSPELTLAILQGLQREATDLADGTLIDAVAVYLTQFGAVLAQEGGPVPPPVARNGRQQSPSGQEPAPAAPAARTTTPAETRKERRRI